MKPGVAILIPAMRPQLIRALCQNIEAVTPPPYHIYVMTNRQSVIDQIADMDVTVWKDKLRSWGKRLNSMYKRTEEEMMFLCADDVWFSNGWLPPALAEMQRYAGVVTVNDTMNSNGTLALVLREYIDRESGCIDQPGVIIHPGYRHAYSETELFRTAMYRNKWTYCPQSVVQHNHFLVGRAPVDDVYEMGIESYGADKEIYQSRCYLWGVDPSTVE
jgi:hypothetical protein